MAKKTPEQLEAERQAKLKERYDEKQRDLVWQQMTAMERENRKKEKIAPDNYIISLQHVNKIYSNHVQAVFDFNLDIEEGEFIVLVGPSGCGKSTTLRMVAGLEDITYGDLYINHEYANQLEPKDRDLAMVFQSYALYPHMTVYSNLAFGLQMRHVPKAEIDERVHKAAQILEIEEYLDRKPRQLSGGQCQRVALGRAIVRDTRIFLMDEPLSNLDAKLRVQMRSELVKLHKQLGATTLYVTHDQTEAMTMASRIVVMKKGYVQQVGTPKEIYNHPANVFVATFIGSPAMNIVEGQYDNGKIIFDNGFEVSNLEDIKEKHDSFYNNEIQNLENENEKMITTLRTYFDKSQPGVPLLKELDDPEVQDMITNNSQINENKQKIETYKDFLANQNHKVLFGIRPEDVIPVGSPTLAKRLSNTFNANITVAELLGNEYYIHFDFVGKDLIGKASAGHDLDSGDNIGVEFDLDKAHVFDIVSEKYIY